MPTTVLAAPSEARSVARTLRAEQTSRFTFLDALRGLAACWVMVYHFNAALSSHGAQPVFAQPIHFLLSHGRMGVQLFFVLSGFVLAYSLRHASVSPRFFGLFLLRRSIRLDPPYWTTIASAFIAVLVGNSLLPSRGAPLPGWPQVAAHLFYLQNILGFGDIVDVFWTLCLEVQLYLMFVLLLGLGQAMAPGRPRFRLFLFVPLTFLSLAIQFDFMPSPGVGFMFKYWYLFQLGVTAFWVQNRTLKPLYLYAFVGMLVVLMGTRAFHVECLGGICAVLTIHVVDRLERLHEWLAQRPLQYLGRISYSLYLVHNLIGYPVVGLVGKYFFGERPVLGMALLLFAIACFLSLLTADLLYRLVERPTQRLSKAIPLPGTKSATSKMRSSIPHRAPGAMPTALRGHGRNRPSA